MNRDPHRWAGQSYHCSECGCAYHCPHCDRGVGMMGHGATDADGFFFTCQEPERNERRMAKWGIH